MVRLTLIFALIYCFQSVQAQQTPLFNQYRDQANIINPAFIGDDYFIRDNNVTIGLSFRSQWTGLDNNPVTQALKGDYIFENRGVSLLTGGYIINDRTGPTGLTGVYGKIGGILSDDPYWGGISFAITAGIQQFRIDTDRIILREQNDIINAGEQNQITPDVGLGVFWYHNISGGFFNEDFVYAGASVPQVLGLNINFADDNGEYNLKRKQHFYAMVGMYKFLSEDSFLQPSAWVRYVANAPVSVDFNLRYQINESFYFGAGSSLSGNFHFETGFILGNQLRIGYGFDYPFNTIGPIGGGSHEININFAFER